MHDLTSSFSLGLAAALGVATVTALWLSPCHAEPPARRDTPPAAVIDAPPTGPAELAALRAQGPAALDALMIRYWRATTVSPIDPRWELAIDTVAGQRYASWSGLYWYTDLALAQDAARRQHRPILALRMLGDLRDDLSCANSRLFRATLYANTELSAFLREHFILYWSSERAVPTVTIDFGDGRKLVRTTTGNSAHYVLDEQGNVLDVLPGLYAPQVFRAELGKSLDLADQVRGLPDAERLRATIAHHAAAIAATDRAWKQARGAQYLPGARFLLGSSALARAQLATVSKMMVEAPDLRAIGALAPADVPDDPAAWSAIGQRIWQIAERGAVSDGEAPAPIVLDDQSRSLVRAIHNAGPLRQPATADELDAVVARLEQHIVADTALNEIKVRHAIRHHILQLGETRLTQLNEWIYDAMFATPSSDPWLGLLPRTDFTGLPGDGVVMP